MLRLITPRTLVYLLLCSPFFFFISLPVMQAGYFSDDILNSLISGSFANQRIDFFHGLMQYMNDALMIGRFYPLSVLSSVSVFYLFPSVTTYQLVRVLFIWLSIFSFAWLMRQITRSASAGWLLVIVVPMCWSIRDMPDPLVSFAVLLPLLSLCMSLSLIFYMNYQQSGLVHWRGMSLLMYLFALSTYEFGLTTLFLLVILAVTSPYARRKSYFDLRPFFLLTLGYVIVSLILRTNRVDGYDGIMLGQVSGFFSTFFAQLASSLPLSYRWLASEPSISFSHLIGWVTAKHDVFILIMYVYALMLIVTGSLIKNIRITRPVIICLMSLGLALMIIPSAMIAMSSKYQHIISPGKGYLGVYLQYFGLGLLLVASIGWFNQQFKSKLTPIILSVVISSLLIYGWILNIYVVSMINNRLSSQRLLIESALRHHLFSDLPQNAVLIEPLLLWNNTDFYRMHSHITIKDIYDINHLTAVKAGSYLIEAHHLTETASGYVLLGSVMSYHAAKINPSIAITDQITTNGLKIFIAARSKTEFYAILQQLAGQLNLSHEEIAMISKHYQNSSYPIAGNVMLPFHRYLINIQLAGMKT